MRPRTAWTARVAGSIAALGLGVLMCQGALEAGGDALTGALQDSGPTGTPAAGENLGRGQTVVVTDVLDGDTLRVRTPDGRDLGRVRLLGINAPEIAHPPDTADCYGEAATRALGRLTPEGSRVVLRGDPTQNDRDVYGRMLRYIDYDGGDVALELLDAGAARLYDSRTPVQRTEVYAAAAETAQGAGRGLWGAC